ncbi:hypothetical protein CY34DRAFT_588790 [Suillus luteus UH-Slu-Lm8-n1]|uniref:Uncharacterized protein n=1 Tax=Suillus luteus UH-Slu-Lm8-n1 TaxID=930992 RepID=A0A0D0A455_9AGAM|nr:hypothetical protein CY34DRAFT_588790 [Suillus luteus UH-Slu-Lm8-n1]
MKWTRSVMAYFNGRGRSEPVNELKRHELVSSCSPNESSSIQKSLSFTRRVDPRKQ